MSERLWNNILPAMIWFGYHAAVPQWKWSFLSGLMLLRALIVLGLFLFREAPRSLAPKHQIAVAWFSTFLPVLMAWQPTATGAIVLVGQVISILGMLLFVFTALDLGKSFGVSPAIRSPVSSGVYRYLQHPMYVSHVIVEAGILLTNPTAWNFAVIASAWALYALRARWESYLFRRVRSLE